MRKIRRVAVRRVGDSHTSTLNLKLELERSKYPKDHLTFGIVGVQMTRKPCHARTSTLKLRCRKRTNVAVAIASLLATPY